MIFYLFLFIFSFHFPVGDRLGNILVGLTVESPADVTPSPGNYDVCTTYVGPVGSGATVTLYCDAGTAGRYLIVQLDKQAAMTLCEVEVFVGGEKIKLIEK